MTTEPARAQTPTTRPSRFWLLISAACLVPAVLDASQAYLKGRLGPKHTVAWGDVIFAGSEWLFLGALTPIAYYVASRFPLRRETAGRTLAVHALGSLVLCAGWASAGFALQYTLGWFGPNVSMGRQFANWMLTSLPYSVFMYFAVLGCVYAFTFFAEARAKEAHAARLASQLAESRLSALRMQLNPHFLFNSLNAIGVLVRDQHTEAASRMIELLADVLQTVLRSDARHEIALGDEIRFVEQYLAIEQVRFSDRLHVAWSVDPSLRGALVPGFILQPLVENALRHGIAKRSEPGTIEISARRDGGSVVLAVIDDGPGVNAVPASETGVGLANTRERILTMYGPAGSLSLTARAGGGTVATIRLPYRAEAARHA